MDLSFMRIYKIVTKKIGVLPGNAKRLRVTGSAGHIYHLNQLIFLCTVNLIVKVNKNENDKTIFAIILLKNYIPH